jgi:acyl-coenzyme A synthetase/AMP-(fatty) acid ligase
MVSGWEKHQSPTFGPPSIVFKGRLWPADEVAAIAAGWLDILHASIPRTAGLTAMLMSNHPHSIALLFALSSLPLPVIVYHSDPRAWRSSPPVPAETPLFVPPSLAEMAASDSLGLSTHVLPAQQLPSAATGPVPFLTGPGFVNFTSGSTGLPKPVYITTQSFLLQTSAIIEACQLSAGSPVAASLQLSTHYGLGQALFLPTVLRSPLGLLERFDHRSLLGLFASERYTYWAGTPVMADMLSRAPLSAPCPAVPPICHISAGKLSTRVFDAFAKRFGVRLRPNYGQTENGFITADTAPEEQVRPDCVGRAAPGIEVRIGDDPLDPYPPRRPGPVWFTSPWYMEGYGFPPRLAPREGRQGWWPTADVGFLDESGYLTLAGRADDCFKTSAGYLVNPGEIAHALTSHPDVTEVIVMPVRSSHGPVIGALVECDGAIDPDELRATAARMLPPWLRPDVVVMTVRLPRLAGGKADREACQGVLREARGRCEPGSSRSNASGG